MFFNLILFLFFFYSDILARSYIINMSNRLNNQANNFYGLGKHSQRESKVLTPSLLGPIFIFILLIIRSYSFVSIGRFRRLQHRPIPPWLINNAGNSHTVITFSYPKVRNVPKPSIEANVKYMQINSLNTQAETARRRLWTSRRLVACEVTTEHCRENKKPQGNLTNFTRT